MAKRNIQQEETGSYDYAPYIESKETIIEEIIKPAVENHIKTKVDQLRAKGFDNNRIAATLMIHKHIVDSI